MKPAKPKDKPVDKPCTTCGKTKDGDCSRAECDRRRPITAGPPDDLTLSGRVAPHLFLWEE